MICKLIIPLLTFYLLFFSCNESELNNEYVGYWAETRFTYQFLHSGNFKFITEGHFGNTITEGKYAKLDSIILLHPYSDWTTHHGVLKNRLILEKGGKYLRDFDFNLYGSDMESLIKVGEYEYEMIQGMKTSLSRIGDVKKGVDSISPVDQYYDNYTHIVQDEMVLINNKLYLTFRLRKRDDRDNMALNPYIYLPKKYYLVDRVDGTVYRHLSKGDEMIEVGKINAANNAPPSTGPYFY